MLGEGKGLLANGYGSYYCIDKDFSYQGWYVHTAKPWRMQKTIEAITPQNEGGVTNFSHQLYGLRRKYASGASDCIIMHQKTLLYSTFSMGRVQLTLDHRETYELSRLGRIYHIEIEEDFVLITFKQYDEKKNIEYEFYMGIKGVKDVELIQSWREKNYSYDSQRKSQSTYWVYDAISFIPSPKAVFSSSSSKIEARTLCDISYFKFDEILADIQVDVRKKLPYYHQITDSKQHAATSMASWSLQQIYQKFQFGNKVITGIYAGYPWFTQIWSRDELISLGGLMTLVKELDDDLLYEEIKQILTRHIKSIQANGMLANRFPQSDLGSIDAFGWLGKRIYDFICLLQEENKLYTLFELPELLLWNSYLKEGLDRAKKHHQEEGLFKNKFNETWMDTSHQDDGRVGYRIEIQALYYSIYETIILLGTILKSSDVHHYASEQEEFKQVIRENFLINGKLIDGFNNTIDEAYRPNIFLAGFVAYDLFTPREWKKIASNYLKKLLLPWGGLSTIESTNPLYQPYYTGQSNESYHRGDSWYFINNIAGIVLHQINPEFFSKEIELIAQGSAIDILDKGLMGHGSEVSSAQEQKAQGALAQAWSVATYLEFMNAVYPK